jgi:hypothetical protein
MEQRDWTLTEFKCLAHASSGGNNLAVSFQKLFRYVRFLLQFFYCHS